MLYLRLVPVLHDFYDRRKKYLATAFARKNANNCNNQVLPTTSRDLMKCSCVTMYCKLEYVNVLRQTYCSYENVAHVEWNHWLVIIITECFLWLWENSTTTEMIKTLEGQSWKIVNKFCWGCFCSFSEVELKSPQRHIVRDGFTFVVSHLEDKQSHHSCFAVANASKRWDCNNYSDLKVSPNENTHNRRVSCDNRAIVK